MSEKQSLYKVSWFPCPNCGNAKMMKVRNDTKAVNMIVFCKKCKTENLINIK